VTQVFVDQFDYFGHFELSAVSEQLSAFRVGRALPANEICLIDGGRCPPHFILVFCFRWGGPPDPPALNVGWAPPTNFLVAPAFQPVPHRLKACATFHFSFQSQDPALE